MSLFLHCFARGSNFFKVGSRAEWANELGPLAVWTSKLGFEIRRGSHMDTDHRNPGCPPLPWFESMGPLCEVLFPLIPFCARTMTSFYFSPGITAFACVQLSMYKTAEWVMENDAHVHDLCANAAVPNQLLARIMSSPQPVLCDMLFDRMSVKCSCDDCRNMTDPPDFVEMSASYLTDVLAGRKILAACAWVVSVGADPKDVDRCLDALVTRRGSGRGWRTDLNDLGYMASAFRDCLECASNTWQQLKLLEWFSGIPLDDMIKIKQQADDEILDDVVDGISSELPLKRPNSESERWRRVWWMEKGALLPLFACALKWPANEKRNVNRLLKSMTDSAACIVKNALEYRNLKVGMFRVVFDAVGACKINLLENRKTTHDIFHALLACKVPVKIEFFERVQIHDGSALENALLDQNWFCATGDFESTMSRNILKMARTSLEQVWYSLSSA